MSRKLDVLVGGLLPSRDDIMVSFPHDNLQASGSGSQHMVVGHM